MTHGIDLVIDPKAAAERIEPLLAGLRTAGFLVDDQTARRAVRDAGMFQALDLAESLKIDLYPREMIPGELGRSTRLEVFEGVSLPVASRPDAAASKLVWVSKGSHKSRRDLRQLWRRAAADERGLVEQLARDLALERLLRDVLTEPDEIERWAPRSRRPLPPLAFQAEADAAQGVGHPVEPQEPGRAAAA